jgi:5-methylcytosine-specific restriction endonuclease McrA
MHRRTTFLLPAFAAFSLWLYWREPGGWALLGLAELLFVPLWPLICLGFVFGLPAVAALAIPRSWRMAYRRRHTRPSVPVRIRRAVLAADRNRCIYCGSQPLAAVGMRLPAVDVGGLQLDHVRPRSCGGLDSLWNFVTLCGHHNRIKSNYWVWPSGQVTYRAFNNYDDRATAAAILEVERRARWNVVRWWRAAWSFA